MKLSLLLFPLLALAAFSASATHAAQVWVDGVSAEQGWIDYEKAPTKGDGDDMLCWAASASNVIDYWQKRYVVPEGTPTGAAIWERFKEACLPANGGEDTAGNFLLAMQWWIGGDYPGKSLEDDMEDENQEGYVESWMNNRAIAQHPQNNIAIPYNPDFDGYYWDCFDNEYEGENYINGKQAHLFNFLHGFDSYSSIEDKILTELSAPMSLSIADTNKKLAHSITLWGLEYTENEPGKVSIERIWITDSDDYTSQLREIAVYYYQYDDNIYLKDYSNYPDYGDIYLTRAFGINTAESDTWDLIRVVPEPASATLSLLALAGAVARRRRKTGTEA